MEITVTGRHIEITPAIRQYATEKVSKLPRYFDRIQSISTVADKKDNHTLEVEIIVQADGHDRFIAKTSGPDLYACIDLAVDKLERQLTDHKERVKSRKGKTSMSG